VPLRQNAYRDRQSGIAQISFIVIQTGLLTEILMPCRFEILIAMLAALLAINPAKAEVRGTPDGIWLTQAGDAKIRVSRCGAGICGIVVWLKEPIDPSTGKPQVDDKNSNPALAKRPIIGLSLFSGMRPSGPNQWAGRIYNADDGKTYASNIAVTGPNSLRVEGCVGTLCGGEDWTRSSR
jgi:uncharacterized protein (DUF2147 family)